MNMNDEQFTIDTREIAEMLSIDHAEVLKKLEGTVKANGRVKQVGIIPTFRNGNIPVSEFFIESTYKVDGNNKAYKCYLCTKKGCEVLGNKFTGEKGIIFTAKYVDRFNSMETLIKDNQITFFNEQIKMFEALINEFKTLSLESRQYYKPLHRTKLELNRLIKSLTSNNQEANLVKRWVFMKMGIRTWEDTCLDDIPRIKDLIQSTSKLVQIDNFEQISLLQ